MTRMIFPISYMKKNTIIDTLNNKIITITSNLNDINEKFIKYQND
jgi:hypothetical protein